MLNVLPPEVALATEQSEHTFGVTVTAPSHAGGVKTPKVSIIVPAYNAEKFIREAIESALAQTLDNIEVIVIDDGSTDGTSAILDAFSDQRLIVLRQDNNGVSAARNAGLAIARAPYIFFLDADDILLPSALQRMIRVLDENPQRVACFAHHIRISEAGTELSTRSYLRWKMFPTDSTLRHLAAKNFISGAICVRTDAARRVQGFNTTLKLGEDWEFWCRLATLGDFAPMPNDIVLLYRQRFGSANFRWRRSPLHPNFQAIDIIYSNPTIRQRFSRVEMRRRRRLAEIDAFWTGARNEYAQGRMLKFLAYMAVGALRYPDSILRPRLVYLFVRGLRQQIRRPASSADPRSAPEPAFRPAATVEFEDQALHASPTVVDASPANGRCLFLLTPSKEACAVEIFTRSLVSAMRARHPDAGYELLPISGRLRDVPFVVRKIVKADRIVFNLPLVAWKRLLLTPLFILLLATAVQCRISVFMHEWSGLHWLRRLALAPIVMLSRTIFVVSPFISDQIASNRWLIGAGAKCRLVPHPPTIRRPPERDVTERIQRVRAAAEDCDVVIGSFGSIYRGKAATALLDLCKHLRDRGTRAMIVFIGNFTKSLDGYEQEFWHKVLELGIKDQVIVTGYIPSEAELYTLFEEISAFLFLFPEGLTARRSSVIACLHSDRPVVVTAPRSTTEFAHHEGFSALIAAGALSFIPPGADLRMIADQLLAVVKQDKRTAPMIDDDSWWDAAMRAVKAAL